MFARDHRLMTLIVWYCPSMIRKLIKWFSMCVEEGLSTTAIPECILMGTNNLFEIQDNELHTCIDECIAFTCDETDFVTVGDIWHYVH